MMCFVSHMTRLWTICMVAISYIPLLWAGFSRVCDRVQLPLRLRPVHPLSHTRSACTGSPAGVQQELQGGLMRILASTLLLLGSSLIGMVHAHDYQAGDLR